MSVFQEFPKPSTRAGNPGRRSSLTLERIGKLSDLLAGGNFIISACRYSGISESTFHTWRLRGETEIDRVGSLPGVDVTDLLLRGADDPTDPLSAAHLWQNRPAKFKASEWPFVVFAIVMERSRAAGEIRSVHAIQQAAAAGDWRAAAWFLEHTAPQRFRNRQQITVEESPLAAQHIVTVDELNDVLGRLGVSE
ncbi:hypothetical protein [Arthrobacter sp. efr-133-TYG-104]|uniref:hypothetical protein n=1 Tax=Arthrobacter sp. efr-133-TYG-104 TaxID=3040324 RepID=UPI00254BA64F|nr:hypothetical protein [Arthrobacter sp. efr-133-TYG-104]